MHKALLNPSALIAPGVRNLFPLTLYHYNGPAALSFPTFEDFTKFLSTLPGYYTVYCARGQLIVDKYVINAGMFTVYHSRDNHE